MRSGNFPTFLKRLLGVLLAVAGVVFVYSKREELTVLSSLQPMDVVLLAAALFGFFVTTGYTFALVLQLLSIRLRPVEFVGLSFIVNFANYLTPGRPGAAVRAIYLKGQKGLSYARFSAVLAANGFVVLFVSGVTGSCLLALFWLQTGRLPLLLVATCLALVAAASLPFFLPAPVIRSRTRLGRALNAAIDGFAEIRTRKSMLPAVCLSILAQHAVSALVFKIAYLALHQDISFVSAFVIGVFTSVANLFTITPNNLGIQEVVTAYLFTVAGFDFKTGLIGAALVRAVHIVLTFACTPVFAHVLFGKQGWSLAALLPGRVPANGSTTDRDGEGTGPLP